MCLRRVGAAAVEVSLTSSPPRFPQGRGPHLSVSWGGHGECVCVCVCVPPRGRCSHAGPQGRLAFVCLGMLPVSLHMGPFWESRYGSGGGGGRSL